MTLQLRFEPVADCTSLTAMAAIGLQVDGSASPLQSALRVLVVEDSPDEAWLLIRALEAAGYAVAWERVDTAESLRAALGRERWDVILCDYVLPGFGGAEAVALVQSLGCDVPLIIVSGQVGEEFAVAAMRAGAHDYVSKENLARLVPAVERELRDCKARAARRRSEEEKMTLLEIAGDIAGSLDLATICERVHRRAAPLLRTHRMVTFCWDSLRPAYRAVAMYNVPESLRVATTELEFPAGDPLVEWLAGGHSLIVNDIEAQNLISAEIAARFRLERLIAAPLVVQGRGVGAVTALGAAEDDPFDAQDLQFLEGVARQLAMGFSTVEAYRAQQREAEVSGALARVGREIIAGLGRPDLLRQLCRVTTEVLHCDLSHTLLLDGAQQTYRVVAGHGDSREGWEELRVLSLPRAIAGGLEAKLDMREVAYVVWDDPQTSLPQEFAIRSGVSSTAYAALRRGDELIGLQTAEYRAPGDGPSTYDERILSGIAWLGSVALDHVRVVEELERANSLKTDFVATMSHELRTPLNVIMGYSDLLLEGEYGDLTTEQADIVRRVDRSAGELLELINATLDLSRLEAGRLSLKEQSVDVAALLREIDQETQPLQQDKPALALEWIAPARLRSIRTDRTKLKVVIKNLVTNAIKFTDTGGVSITATPREGGVEIAVRDTGIGIAPQDLDMIFEPFRQLDSSVTRRFSGVGLGLYIVRRLVDMLGGTIEVESAAGSGSTFRVWVRSARNGTET